MKATFSQVRHPSHPGRGCGSLTCHMTHFEQSDWLRSPNLTNIMIEYAIKPRVSDVIDLGVINHGAINKMAHSLWNDIRVLMDATKYGSYL